MFQPSWKDTQIFFKEKPTQRLLFLAKDILQKSREKKKQTDFSLLFSSVDTFPTVPGSFKNSRETEALYT